LKKEGHSQAVPTRAKDLAFMRQIDGLILPGRFTEPATFTVSFLQECPGASLARPKCSLQYNPAKTGCGMITEQFTIYKSLSLLLQAQSIFPGIKL
jgi:hypothetical protein